MRKYIGISILVVSIVLTIIIILSKNKIETINLEVQKPLVKVAPFARETINAKIKSQGFILPRDKITIYSEVNAKIDWIAKNMSAGSSFKEGDTLIKFDNRDYELALISAKSNVLNAKVNFEREQAEFDLANKEWNRLGSDIASDLALRKPQLEQAKAIWDASKAAFEKAQRNLERTIIKAPFNGRVINENISVGSNLFQGNPLANIFCTDYYQVRLPITDKDINFTGLIFDGEFIPSDKQLEVIIHLDNDNFIEGKIIRTESEKDFRTKMVVLVAEIDPSKNINNSMITINQFVEAEIKGVRLDNIIQVPRILLRDDSIWVVDIDYKLRKQKVEVIRYENNLAIIKANINKSDNLLISRINTLFEGMLVDIEIN